MVCPKCGRDCGNDAFCGGCGTKLEAAQTRNTGRLCPHCGGTEAIGNICAYCGLEIERTVHPEADSYEMPLTAFHSANYDRLHMGQDALLICSHCGLFKRYETRIPYAQLTKVVYWRPFKRKKGEQGCLLLRYKGNQDMPIPPRKDFCFDTCRVMISPEEDALFYQIFLLLRSVAPQTAGFVAVCPPENYEGLEEWEQGIDFESLFQQFSPYREAAAKDLVRRRVIPLDAARNIVDKAFDKRQQTLYQQHPQLLLRDMNRLEKEYRRIEEAKKRERVKETVPEDFDD